MDNVFQRRKREPWLAVEVEEFPDCILGGSLSPDRRPTVFPQELGDIPPPTPRGFVSVVVIVTLGLVHERCPVPYPQIVLCVFHRLVYFGSSVEAKVSGGVV